MGKTYLSLLLVILMILTGFVGFSANINHGFYNRLSSETINIFSQLANNYSNSSYQNENCINAYPSMREFHACLMSKNTPPEIIIAGDSHGLQYYEALRTILPKKNVINISEFICLPFLSNFVEDNFSKDCKIRQDALIKFLTENRSVKTIVLAARWNSVISPDLKLRDPSYNFSKSKDYQSFISNGTNFLRKINYSNPDIKIIVILDNPELSKDIRTCFRSGLGLSHLKKVDCSIDRIIYDNYIHFADKALLQITQNLKNVIILNPRDYLCNDTDCDIIKNDSLIYFDKNHLTFYGASFVVRGLANNKILDL